MGRKARTSAICLMLLASLLLLAGCTSIGAVLRANISGMPFWYYEPQMNIGSGRVGMVGEGSASTERQAELLAYSDVINKLSERLGYELSQESYRELSVLGTITEFGLSVDDTFRNTQEGRYQVYLHVSMDRNLIESATSDETKRRESLTKTVTQLVLQGDEYVKSGSETKAVSNYIKAMTLSYNEDYISSEYRYDELYPVVLELLENISISISSTRADIASCEITIVRRGSFASSAVTAAEVLSSYQAEDTRGKIYDDYFVYVTDTSGQFVFNPINAAIVRNGSVKFELNLSSEIDALEAVAGAEKVSELRSLVESKSVLFEYSKAYFLGSIAVAVIEHDNLGYVTGVKDITDYMAKKMADDGAQASSFYAELDEEEDVLYEFTHSDRTESCLLVIRVGRTEHVSSRIGMEVVGAEGIVTLFDRDSEVPLYRSDIIYSSAFADTYEEALQGAFRKLADIAYTLVKAVYV